MRWFRGSGDRQNAPLNNSKAQPRTLRHSAGLAEFMRRIAGEEKLCVLDLGQTSPVNIPFLTQRGARVYNEDLLRAFREKNYLVKQEDGAECLDVTTFFAENFDYSENQFDAILCWDIADYLPEPVVKPLVEKLHKMLKPGGTILGFFHTQDAGPDAPYFRYHIVQNDTLELAQGPNFRLQRVFNNRHVENLFKNFSSLKFFLGRDQIREVLVVR
ncbi:MAG TPA: class I SAM-dependent methyltransferase [Verrucomicrobiae bacterium]|jgi:SAM-dependent methyltransferase|nr:class I SAM-dependent methyltransferase [Verrucomicrobiae bacterium]